jgi:hypothetical protein
MWTQLPVHAHTQTTNNDPKHVELPHITWSFFSPHLTAVQATFPYEQDFTRETNPSLNADKPQTFFLILLKILTMFGINIMVVIGNRSAVLQHK